MKNFISGAAVTVNSYASPGRIGPAAIAPTGVLNTPCRLEAWFIETSEETKPDGSPSSACISRPFLRAGFPSVKSAALFSLNTNIPGDKANGTLAPFDAAMPSGLEIFSTRTVNLTGPLLRFAATVN